MYETATNGLTISTALAVEGYFPTGLEGKNNPIPSPKRPLSAYNSVWLNLRTLIRNHTTAYPTEALATLDVAELIDIIQGEISILTQLFSGKVVKVYLSAYKDVYQQVKTGEHLRDYPEPTGGWKAVHHRLSTGILHTWPTVGQGRMLEGVHHLPNTLPGNRGENALVLTHLPYDLLSYNRFGLFTLMESHTGVMKDPILFNTKYASLNGVAFNNIPFTERFLRFFGDNTMFKPMGAMARRTVVELAAKRRWTPATSHSRVLTDLKQADKLLALMYLDKAL